jgi:hypothetical protein
MPSSLAPGPAEVPRPKSPWTLEKSIWGPRKKWSDGKSYYDDDNILRRAMAIDSRGAREDGLSKHIVLDYDGGEPPTPEEMQTELDEVLEALVSVARPIYSLFDYYASLGSGGSITTITFNGYKQLVADAQLSIDKSKHCDDSHLDQLFVQVNSAGAVAAAAAARATGMKTQGSRAFARSEMVHMLVRVAINRQILDGKETDVSNAVAALCRHLETKLVPAAKQSADDFRRAFCYTEAVHDQLIKHKRSLRAIFDVYAAGSMPKEYMGFDDWMMLLRHLLFFDEAFQQREGCMAFVFSRLRAIDENSQRGKARLNLFCFEDFLEAIVRCATMKALPTTAELLLLGATDCGTFMTELRANPQAYTIFVEARERSWGDKLRQPIARCVEHLLSLLVRTVESSTSGGSDCKLSKSEVVRFRHQGGANIGDAKANAAKADGTKEKPDPSKQKALAGSAFGLVAKGEGASKPAVAGDVSTLADKYGGRALKWGSKAKGAGQEAGSNTSGGGPALLGLFGTGAAGHEAGGTASGGGSALLGLFGAGK